jgi:elongation factor P
MPPGARAMLPKGKEEWLLSPGMDGYKQTKEHQPMYSSSDLKKGLKIMIDGEPHVIEGFDFSKPGKGQALYKCKLRNMITGSLFDRTYRSGESFEPAPLEERDMQYLYKDEAGYVFMDAKTFEQVVLPEQTLGNDY